MSVSVHHGSCLCRCVRYELKGEPFTYLLCHCRNCQKATGSAFMANAFFKPDQVIVVEGKGNVKTYLDHETTSGSPLSRSFCSNCGSSLFLTTPKNDLVIVPTGTIEDEVDWAPRRETHIERKRAWLAGAIKLKPKAAKVKL